MKSSFNSDLIGLLLITCVVFVYGDIDWCDKKLCGKQHVKCGDTGKLGRQCSSDAELIPMTPDIKASIVDSHNKYRSQTAQGLEGLEPAARMLELKWNDGLQEVAEAEARLCTTAHDKCRKTAEFPFSGQNLAWTISSIGSDINLTEKVITRPEAWFNEYKDTKMKHINNFDPPMKEFMQIGHFTCLANDQQTCVGCAAVTYTRKCDKKKIVLLACNYSNTNMRRHPVYKAGAACSGCITGCNNVYPGLCGPQEELSLFNLNKYLNSNVEIPQLPQLPQLPEIPQLPELPQLTQIPPLPELPELPQLPQF